MAKSAKKVEVRKTEAAKAGPAQAPSPMSALAGMRDEIDGIFERYFRGFPSLARQFSVWEPMRAFESLGLPKWGMSPNVEISETDNGYVIEAELPGLEDKDIDVTVTDDRITIKGEKQEQRDEKKKDFHVQERRYGTFERSFRLPDDVDAGKISASLRKGVLTLNMPKSGKAKVRAKQIKVSSA